MERAVTALARALHRFYPDATAEDVADWIWLAACMMPAIDRPAEQAQLPPPPPQPFQDPRQITTIPRTELESAERLKDPRTEPKNGERPEEPRPEPKGSERPEDPRPEPSSADLRLPEFGTDRAEDALPFRTPGGRALPRPLDVVRALRPLVQRVPALDGPQILDEEASIRRAVDGGLSLPVFRPRNVPWLELALVIDESPSMIIWNQTIHELQTLLAHHGAFRDLRVWRLCTESNSQEVSFHTPSGSGSRSYKELINPARRCLILIVTDCISPAWQGEILIQWLKAWGQVHPVTIMQMLPEQFWSLGRLETASPVAVTAAGSAIPNAKLRPLQRLPQWLGASPDDKSPVPVITLEPDSLGDWARFIAGGGTREIPAFLFHRRGLSETKRPEFDFARFRANASPTAFKLACFLAAAPLRLPVMQLIRQVLVPEANQTHMAEFLLSGLLKQVVPSKEPAASNMPQARPDWDQIEYDFVDDNLRHSLLEAGLITDAAQVQDAVSDYIAEHHGGENFFRAVIVDPESAGEVTPPQGFKTFAKVSAAVLNLLGRPYRELASRLSQLLDPVSDAPKPAQSIRRRVGDGSTGSKNTSARDNRPKTSYGKQPMSASPAASNNYNIFFSHKRQDHPVVKSIIDLILYNTENITCSTSEDIEKGVDWRDAIAKLLTRSRSLVLVFTDPDEDWGWCLYETGFFDALSNITQDTQPRRIYCLHNASNDPPSPIANLQSIPAKPGEVSKWLNSLYEVTDQPQHRIDKIPIVVDEICKLFADSKKPIYSAKSLNISVSASILRSPDDLPDDTVVAGDGTILEELFGTQQTKVSWRLVKERFSSRPRTSEANLNVLKEISRAVYFISRNTKLMPIQGAIFVEDGPKRYRPVISDTQESSAGFIRCKLLLVEDVGGQLQNVDKGLGALLTAIRMGVRIRWEVIRPFVPNLESLAAVNPFKLRFDLQTCLNNILLEAELRGNYSEGDVLSAFLSQDDKAKITELINGFVDTYAKIWGGLGFANVRETFGECSGQPFLSGEIALLKGGLQELEKMNKDLLDISIARAAVVIRQELGVTVPSASVTAGAG